MITLSIFCVLTIAALCLWFRETTKRKEFCIKIAVLEEKNSRLSLLENALKEKEAENIHLMSKQIAAEEKLQLVQSAHEKLNETFKALSLDALERNNRSFLDLAQATLAKFQEGAKGDLEKRQQSISELVSPVKEALGKLDQGIRQLEKERKGDHESLQQQVRSLLETEKHLRTETASLVKALRAPITRGRWGEIQLKRVVELAGMLNHCDFHEQQHHVADDVRFRPDLVVHLPGGKQVVVDAKTPLDAYLEAIQAEDDVVKELKLKDHSRQVRAHVMALSRKSYWEQFQPTPEFVILFLPSDTFFSAALEYDPSLIEVGVDQGVILATPSTLIALLRTVAYGWKQENLSRHVQQVSELGQDLYKRIVDMASHWTKMGRSLSTAVEHYNKAVGSLEARVLVTARKFRDFGAAPATAELDPIEVVERLPRLLQAPEMTADQKDL
jgi:DNA recombination protein RmuC